MPPSPTLINRHDSRFQAMLGRHRAFWSRAESDSLLRSAGIFAPSMPIALPQPDGTRLTDAERLTPDMIDPASLIAEVEAWDSERLDSTLPAQGQYLVSVGLGDMMPTSKPLVKIPWIEAMLGCPIKMTNGHIWNEHYSGDPEEVIQGGVHFQGNPWFELYLEFIRQLQGRLSRHYPTSAGTLLRGASDLAAAVMGVQEACIGWIDQPQFMTRLMRVCTDAILTVVEAGWKLIQPLEGGYMCHWGIWSPAPVVWAQADHSTLLSARMYERQILPFDREVMRSCPVSVMHIHNCGLHIAPLLVQIPELTAIECAVDPYPAGERKAWEIRSWQMIQEYKPLILDFNFPSLEEADWMLTQLSPRGLMFNARFESDIFATLPANAPGAETWLLA